MSPLTRAVLCACLAASSLPALAAPPPGRLLAAQCAQCHGTDGVAVADIDSLAGMDAAELSEDMQEMQAQATGQPKAGRIANAEAKVCADAVLSGLDGHRGRECAGDASWRR